MTTPTIKWVKRANMWAVTTYEFDKKKNKVVNKVSWHLEKPTLEEQK